MADLVDGEWELSYPGCELVFGTIASGRYFLTPPDLGSAEIEAGDQPPPRGDGTAFGVDTLTGPTFTFEIGVDQVDQVGPWAAVLDAQGDMRRAWRADVIRRQPRAVAVLRTRNAGRTRRVYGRPRKFAPTPAKFDRRGYNSVVAEFKTADDLFYGDEPTLLTVGIVPPFTGGLSAPLSAPLTATAATSSASRMLGVAGDEPSWLQATVYGPITDPVIDIVGVLTVTLRLTIASDQRVDIDARPWVRRALTSAGASVAGAFTADTPRLSNMTIPPGYHEVALRGVDATGTASLSIEVEHVYNNL